MFFCLWDLNCSSSVHKYSTVTFDSHSLQITMRVSTLAAAQVGLLNVLPAAAEYVWPNKHDRMEDLLVLQNGFIREGFTDGTYHAVVDVVYKVTHVARSYSMHPQPQHPWSPKRSRMDSHSFSRHGYA